MASHVPFPLWHSISSSSWFITQTVESLKEESSPLCSSTSLSTPWLLTFAGWHLVCNSRAITYFPNDSTPMTSLWWLAVRMIRRCLSTLLQRGPGSGASHLVWGHQICSHGVWARCAQLLGHLGKGSSPRSLSTLTSASLSRLPSHGFPTFANSFPAAIASSLSACLGVALNIFHLLLLPISSTLTSCRVCRGAEFCSGSAPAMRLQDGATRRWSRYLLEWPRGSPVASVHIESGWPDARLLIAGQLLFLFGRIPSMPMGDCTPLPASVSRPIASSRGSLIATCGDLCTATGIVASSSFGVGPNCSAQRGSLSVLSLHLIGHSAIDC